MKSTERKLIEKLEAWIEMLGPCDCINCHNFESEISILKAEMEKESQQGQTAEEILEKHCGKINVPFDNYAIEYHTAIIEAMEEYAAQVERESCKKCALFNHKPEVRTRK